MSRYYSIAPLLVVLSYGIAIGQDELPSPDKAADASTGTGAGLKTVKQQKSYAVGYDFAANLRMGEADVDAPATAKGVYDGLLGKKLLFSDEQMRELLTMFEKEMQARQMARLKKAGEHNMETAKRFLADNKKREGVQVTKSGLQYKIIKPGKGPKPKATSVVQVHYHGTHVDGSIFDSSLKDDPVQFRLNGVIPGWTEALQLMRVGGKWQLFIPPELAYGLEGRPSGGIGPNEVLVFEVELLGIVK